MAKERLGNQWRCACIARARKCIEHAVLTPAWGTGRTRTHRAEASNGTEARCRPEDRSNEARHPRQEAQGAQSA